jgi:hypothetical protein
MNIIEISMTISNHPRRDRAQPSLWQYLMKLLFVSMPVEPAPRVFHEAFFMKGGDIR